MRTAHDQILEFLAKHNQTNILKIIPVLSKVNKNIFFSEVKKYQKIYQGGPHNDDINLPSPLENCPKVDFNNYKLGGFNSIKKQEVACMVFAGGEGSRFGFNKAKGLFCIERNNSLFSNLCKWILAYEVAFKIKIPLLFLVSSKNKNEIKDHFEKNQFFKLDPNLVMFIEQANYPFFDERRQWVLDHNNKIVVAPNGNGDFFEALQSSNAISFFKKQNITYLQVFFIDNPLIDPLDPNLVGFLINQKLDAAIHVFERDDPNEKVGVICEDNGRNFVVDYMQMSKSTFKKMKNKHLFYPYANSGHFCISVDSLSSLMDKKVKLPFHWVWKKAYGTVYAWKAEKFAFDLFPYLNCKSLCYDKKSTFAPLKTVQDVKSMHYLLNQKNQTVYQRAYWKKASLNFELMTEDIVNYLKKENGEL